MSTTTMTSKGQVTVPKEIRELLGLKTGDKIAFVPLGGRRAAIVPRNRSVEDLFGIFHDPDAPTMTIEDMNESIAEGAAASGMGGFS
ncbi:AbrB/MazE/SpoVT family DNA-binding domain-containing protein [Tessaracoccus caeni]|uniref:AbrB/MazE/SpoVT family DNA-binding domain-containing protein n=1 Tax=Tessaracoccus caeni TaxID=3031239 RepID=UPI0023DBF055|nr:AbrB/MazE/SpoVT family DNA-binding domain-containing protein [Tessaracoccus caeni]MDF1490028.1 AbrB/MazE/SpoVT family DNA-binding domain-containing protein [Tessaracoccus caeni]